MHHWSVSITVQRSISSRSVTVIINNCLTRCNTKQSIYYSASSLYMFRASTAPIIRSTQNCNYSLRYCAATSLQRDQAWLRWNEVAVQKICPVPEAVVTVLCTPDDGCSWHPNHVEWTCRIIKRLLYVASRWTIINIKTQYCENCSHTTFIGEITSTTKQIDGNLLKKRVFWGIMPCRMVTWLLDMA